MQKRQNIRAWFKMYLERTSYHVNIASDDIYITSDHNDVNVNIYINHSKRWWDWTNNNKRTPSNWCKWL